MDLSQALVCAVSDNALENGTAVDILDEGAGAHLVHYNDDEALLQAVRSDKHSFTKLLCERGANPLARDGAVLAAATENHFAERFFDDLFKR